MPRLISPLPAPPERIPGKLQDLDPQSAHLVLRVERLLREKDNVHCKNADLLLGVSGGTDSLALLVIFAALRERLGCKLKVCHVNHCLRPTAAAEQDWVAEFCARLEVEFHSRVADVAALAAQKQIGLEEAGREARLAAFREIAAQDESLIVTGHTLNDLAEDVLMRLLRGSGWPALAGMDRFNPKSRIVRPLLFIERAELTAFLDRLELPPLEDESNAEPDFLRNRLRLGVVPLLLGENPGWLDQVRTLKRLAEVDAAYWLAEVERRPAQIFAPGEADIDFMDYDASRKAVFLDRRHLRDTPQALRLRLFMHCLQLLGGGQALADNLLALDRAWLGEGGVSHSSKVIQLPGRTAARTTKDGLWFYFQN